MDPDDYTKDVEMYVGLFEFRYQTYTCLSSA